jgi:hypothetical protein
MKRCKDIAVLTVGLLAAIAARAQTPEHHHHGGVVPSSASSSIEIPPLKILMPQNGDAVGTTVGVIFETPADLAAMTMGGPHAGVHLHAELADNVVMPTRQQLIGLGGNRYLFLFDLPVRQGPNTIKIYWADEQHRTITASVQKVEVTAKP